MRHIPEDTVNEVLSCLRREDFANPDSVKTTPTGQVVARIDVSSECPSLSSRVALAMAADPIASNLKKHTVQACFSLLVGAGLLDRGTAGRYGCPRWVDISDRLYKS